MLRSQGAPATRCEQAGARGLNGMPGVRRARETQCWTEVIAYPFSLIWPATFSRS